MNEECTKSMRHGCAERKYGIIFEGKAEQPLMMESPLKTYDEASETMRRFSAQNSIIRVAMYEAVYVTGNETLLPPKPKPMPF